MNPRILQLVCVSVLTPASLLMSLTDQSIAVTATPYQPPPAPDEPPLTPEAGSPEQPAPAEGVDERAPVDPAWLTKVAAAGGRKLSSSVWTHVQELTDDCPKKGDFTHLCTYPLGDGKVCNCWLKLGFNKNIKKFVTTVAVSHHRNAHPTSRAGKEAIARTDDRQEQADSDMAAAGLTKASPQFVYSLSKHELALTFQARWIIYSRSKVRKSELMSDVFRDMLRAIGTKDTPILGRKSLVYYLNGEFNSFLKFLAALLKKCVIKAMGNTFVQYLHDGATLDNHLKYQGVAIQVIDPDWKCNHVVAIALKCAPCPLTLPSLQHPPLTLCCTRLSLLLQPHAAAPASHPELHPPLTPLLPCAAGPAPVGPTRTWLSCCSR